MTTNAELIVEARALTSWYVAGSDWVVQATELVPRLADALEAAEAQVAATREEVDAFSAEAVRLLGCLQHIYDTTTDASLKAYAETAIISDEWPADLLAAVRQAVLQEADDLPDEIREARAVLVRYGLLKEAR